MRKALFCLVVFCLLATVSLAEPGPAADGPVYALQTAAFARRAAAEAAAARLQGQGLAAYVATNQGGLSVVRVGFYPSRAEARREATRLQAEGVANDCLVVQTQTPRETPAPPDPVDAEAPAEAVGEETPPAGASPLPGDSGTGEVAAQGPTVGSRVADTLEIVTAHPVGPQSLGFRAARVALDFLGVKYRWGGMSRETGMDCSGFVKTVYALCGINLPRTSSEQYRQGQPIDRSELVAGDLVFFGRNQRVNHVGIYLGDGQFIHAPRAKETIRISSLEERSALRKFLGARRLWFDH